MVSSVKGAKIAAVKVPNNMSWVVFCLIAVSPMDFQNIGISKYPKIEEINGYKTIETIKNPPIPYKIPLPVNLFL